MVEDPEVAWTSGGSQGIPSVQMGGQSKDRGRQRRQAECETVAALPTQQPRTPSWISDPLSQGPPSLCDSALRRGQPQGMILDWPDPVMIIQFLWLRTGLKWACGPDWCGSVG